MANIRKEPCGGLRWMIVLFIVISFIIGCVDWMSAISFRMCCVFDLSSPVGDKFF